MRLNPLCILAFLQFSTNIMPRSYDEVGDSAAKLLSSVFVLSVAEIDEGPTSISLNFLFVAWF